MARVLVVDDDANCGTFLRLFLADEGHDVQVCVSGQDALNTAASFAPDVLITDWLLRDGSDGLKLANATRALLPTLSVIFITGMPGADLQPHIQHFPGALVFEKPLDLDRLLPTIKALGSRAQPG